VSYTFLQLVNRLASEAGVTGNASTVSAVTGQSGEAARLVNWITQAHTELQNRHGNWRWMRSTFSVSATLGDDQYAGTDCTDSRLGSTITRFAHWIPIDDAGCANVKIYLTSGGVSGERFMVFIPWDYFMTIYKRGPQNNGPPVHFTIDPQNNLRLGPKPDDTYTVSGEYQMSALEFSANTDTPEFPSRFQDIVWMRAMEKYGRFHAAPEVLARGEVEGGRLMRQLEVNQLPDFPMATPLA
jgi:hypothetical protein